MRVECAVYIPTCWIVVFVVLCTSTWHAYARKLCVRAWGGFPPAARYGVGLQDRAHSYDMSVNTIS